MTAIVPLRKIARMTIPRGIALGIVILASGCGGQDESARAVEWEVFRATGPRQAKLVAQIDYCVGAPKPTIERAVIKYSGNRVFIELFLARQEPWESDICLDKILGVYKKVTFKQDLDELVLLDSSPNPPERRWPD